MSVQHRITTFDNPFDPFDDYDSWLSFDVQMNYNTNEMLARVDRNSDELSDRDRNISTEQAIDDIIRVDPFLMYRKVSREVKDVFVSAE